MWYVIQVRSGEEQDIKNFLEHSEGADGYKLILPLYEEVWRREGVGHISIKKIFPGYLFLDTKEPEAVRELLKKTPKFARILGSQETDGEPTTMYPISSEDEEFIKSLTDDGVMHVSYIQRSKTGRIERIEGPLANYANKIKKIDLPHRRAIVEDYILGKDRTIKFCLWTDADPKIPWIEERLQRNGAKLELKQIDIGVKEGDVVCDDTGIYGDQKFKVIHVDASRRTLLTKTEFFGTEVQVELMADHVRLIRT